MKILLSGAQGVGKSTLNNELIKNEQFRDYLQLDSISTKFAKSKDDMKDSLKFQQNITLYAYSEYLNNSNYISSRGIADGYAYQKYSYLKTRVEKYKTLMDLSIDLSWQFNDTVNIYVPIMFEIESTKYRSGDKEFQKIIDEYVQEYFERVNIPFYTLKSLNINERVNEILNYIRNKNV